jgi:hypothetical protein
MFPEAWIQLRFPEEFPEELLGELPGEDREADESAEESLNCLSLQAVMMLSPLVKCMNAVFQFPRIYSMHMNNKHETSPISGE